MKHHLVRPALIASAALGLALVTYGQAAAPIYLNQHPHAHKGSQINRLCRNRESGKLVRCPPARSVRDPTRG